MAERNITNDSSLWISHLLVGFIFVVIGILFAVYQRDAMQTIIMIAGVLSLVVGLVTIALSFKNGRGFPILAAIPIAIGLVLFIIPEFIGDALMVLIAIGLIVCGAVYLFGALARTEIPNAGRIFGGVIGAVTLAAGLYAIFNLNNSENIVMIIIGAFMIFIGVMQVAGSIKLYQDFH